MNENPYTIFIDLITIDQEIRALLERVQTIDAAIAGLHDQEKNSQATVEQARTAAFHAKKNVDELELEMRMLDQKIRDKKHRLDNTSGHKEYVAFEKEIKQLQAEQNNLEEQVLQAWNKFDAANKAADQAHQTVTTTHEQIKQSLAEQQAQKNQFMADMATKEQERLAKQARVPEEYLEKYNTMRLKISDPVVPVIDGSCSACYYAITGQDKQLLARNKLLQCRSCYRLLYLP